MWCTLRTVSILSSSISRAFDQHYMESSETLPCDDSYAFAWTWARHGGSVGRQHHYGCSESKPLTHSPNPNLQLAKQLTPMNSILLIIRNSHQVTLAKGVAQISFLSWTAEGCPPTLFLNLNVSILQLTRGVLISCTCRAYLSIFEVRLVLPLAKIQSLN